MAMFILYEHASGFGLFGVKEFEEVSMLQSQLTKNVTEFGKFASMVKLHAFSPFKSAANALDNINCISEGLLHDDLKLFLDTNLSQFAKGKMTLGVGDTKIGAAIQEELGFQCKASGVTTEIIRGVRYHFHRFVKGLTEEAQSKAQLGLGHSYSRAKVKFNVHRVDNMIIQSISLLDQLDKDINTFSMRIKEWYSYHFPEMAKIITDNAMYAKVANFIKDRKSLTEDRLEDLEEIVMDSAKARALLDANKSSMGMDISPLDLINISSFSVRVVSLNDYRKSLHTYLYEKMHAVAPNLSTLIGEQVGARLISHAGSLTNLAKYPASTVQILGAEKALFRALKTKGNTPKYGLIFHSTFIGRAAQKNKGRISRYLANKCSIASRIDCFSDVPTHVFGERLRQQVEDRLKFYETGEVPEKNLVIMRLAAKDSLLAVESVLLQRAVLEKTERKQKRKMLKAITAKQEEQEEEPARKRKKSDINGDEEGLDLSLGGMDTSGAADVSVTSEKKKKKKRKKRNPAQEGMDQSLQSVDDSMMSINTSSVAADISVNGDGLDLSVGRLDTSVAANVSGSAKKKKKKKSLPADESLQFMNDSIVSMDTSGAADTSLNGEKKKKKKKKPKQQQ